MLVNNAGALGLGPLVTEPSAVSLPRALQVVQPAAVLGLTSESAELTAVDLSVDLSAAVDLVVWS